MDGALRNYMGSACGTREEPGSKRGLRRLGGGSESSSAAARASGGGAPRAVIKADREWIDVPGGRATLGIDRGASVFGWDNEHPAASVEVGPFSIERHN